MVLFPTTSFLIFPTPSLGLARVPPYPFSCDAAQLTSADIPPGAIVNRTFRTRLIQRSSSLFVTSDTNGEA